MFFEGLLSRSLFGHKTSGIYWHLTLPIVYVIGKSVCINSYSMGISGRGHVNYWTYSHIFWNWTAVGRQHVLISIKKNSIHSSYYYKYSIHDNIPRLNIIKVKLYWHFYSLLSYPISPGTVTSDVLISHCNLEWVLSLTISFLNAACDQS